MKPIYLVFSTALLFSASLFAAPQNDPLDPQKLQKSIDKVVAKVAPATVEIRSLGRGGNGTFSGVIV
ncbi:MAG: hypothetical protein OIF34_09475, partial [Porticoccaceae bacterium]|nr:hypothetical protein [Porticoccaceae bacterium]